MEKKKIAHGSEIVGEGADCSQEWLVGKVIFRQRLEEDESWSLNLQGKVFPVGRITSKDLCCCCCLRWSIWGPARRPAWLE